MNPQRTSNFDLTLASMIDHQYCKVLERGKKSVPHLTMEDILNPHDYEALSRDPIFNYEEGMAAGLMAARAALRAEQMNTGHDLMGI